MTLLIDYLRNPLLVRPSLRFWCPLINQVNDHSHIMGILR